MEYQPKVISPFVHSCPGKERKSLLLVPAWARPLGMPNRMEVTLLPQERHSANNILWTVGTTSMLSSRTAHQTQVWFGSYASYTFLTRAQRQVGNSSHFDSSESAFSMFILSSKTPGISALETHILRLSNLNSHVSYSLR